MHSIDPLLETHLSSFNGPEHFFALNLCSTGVLSPRGTDKEMLLFARTRVAPPLPVAGVGSSGDVLHLLVRAAISATPAGSMRMMSAGLMVELLVEQGLAQQQAKRLATETYFQIASISMMRRRAHSAPTMRLLLPIVVLCSVCAPVPRRRDASTPI